MTIKEIARLAGVSISTVSKIVNNKDQNLNPKTRERVLQIVKEYNYTPYGTVRNLSPSRSFLLGVLLRDTQHTSTLINGIMHTAQRHGYHILLLDSRNDPDTELKHITSVCKNQVDGLLWEPFSEESLEHAHYLEEHAIPVCYINHHTLPTSFCIDFQKMGYDLTQKLLDSKHTNIACVLKHDSFRSQMVFEGFKKCLFDHQITFERRMELYIEDTDCISTLTDSDISGIVCSHYSAALMLYEQITKLHYNIPSDFSMVSLKDNIRHQAFFPHISSMLIPHYEFGSFACEQLINRCEKTENISDSYLFTASSSFDTESSVDVPPYFHYKRIVSVGSINMDYTFNVDQIPQVGKTTAILNATLSLGGKGANQAVGAARLGREVALIGELGNDPDSSYIIDYLEKEHVITHGIHRDMQSPTGKAYIYIDPSAESTISILHGANQKLSAENILRRQFVFENCGYCLISTELSLDTVLEAARTAKRYGARTIVKPSVRNEFPEELYQNTDILVPNKKEAAAICPSCSMIEDQANLLFQKGIPIVIITLGKEGCFLKTAETEKFFSPSQFPPVDTTGGADAFISALATYLVEGYSLERAIRIANYAAGFCISRQGVAPALVDRSTLHMHIKRIAPDLLRFE